MYLTKLYVLYSTLLSHTPIHIYAGRFERSSLSIAVGFLLICWPRASVDLGFRLEEGGSQAAHCFVVPGTLLL